MKLISAVLVTLLLISCSEKSKSFDRVKIETIFTDSLSIRAIAPLNENRVWFAANKGMVGLIDGNIPKLAT
ncbi:MAG TPA: oxidoreductase, partial [Flavobacteriaceae bacterium]|nr:oxidoreductase [Flavobacteriaceae bacterium]